MIQMLWTYSRKEIVYTLCLILNVSIIAISSSVNSHVIIYHLAFRLFNGKDRIVFNSVD